MAAVNNQKSSRTTTIVSAQVARRLPAPKARSFGTGGFSGLKTSIDPPMKRATFLQKATREAKLDAHRRKLAKPSVMLLARKTELTKAPERLLEEKRIQNQFDIDSASVLEGPRIRPATSSRSREQRDREARLLQIKNGGKSSSSSSHAPNVLSFDDDDDLDDHHYDNGRHSKGDLGEDMDDLFGDMDDDDDAGSPPHKSASAPSKKRGLLSAAPGANSRPQATATSARPASNTTTSRPPASTSHASRSFNSGRPQPAASPSSASPSGSPPGAKRKQANIFMKPAKKVRRV